MRGGEALKGVNCTQQKKKLGNMSHILTLVSASILSANDLYGITFYPISHPVCRVGGAAGGRYQIEKWQRIDHALVATKVGKKKQKIIIWVTSDKQSREMFDIGNCF